MIADLEMRLSGARDTCLMYMNQAGFPIRQEVAIQLDPKLPFMGYTTEVQGHPLIVVSSFALDPGPLEGLIIHEMGHIYRGETKHPSHNYPLLEELLEGFTKKHNLTHDYQLIALRSIINTIQDLYADDISFTVYAKHPQKTFAKDVFPEFFATWIRRPVSPVQTNKDKWNNAEGMVSAAFAKSNLERHGIPDTKDIVGRTMEAYLKELDPLLLPHFFFFVDFLTHLPANPAEKEFRKMMEMYFEKFVELTK